MASPRSEPNRLRLHPLAAPELVLSLPDSSPAPAPFSIWRRMLLWTRAKLSESEASVVDDDELQSIRKIVVIGIHGWAILGGRLFSWSPSEVSSRMAQALSAALRQRLKHAQPGAELDVRLVPLFGHGLVDHRLDDVLLEQLPAHRPAFDDADAVFVAAHSQGAILAGLLMKTLLDHGWVRRQRRLGLLLMAGPYHGPFPDLPNDRFPATTELFALGRPYADLGDRALTAVADVLRRGVRVAAVGADRDAVVPMFSSVLHALGHHRRMLRAVYVERRSRSGSFPVLLVQLCLAWANTRPAPSDLLPHLSGLYRGALLHLDGSHSSIHQEPAVYDLAAHWFLTPGDESGDADAIAFMEHTSAHWAVHLNDAFYYSELNAYFIRTRLSWLLDRAEPDPTLGVAQLRSSFATWTPTKKSMRHLRTVIEPLFAVPAPSDHDVEKTVPLVARL